MMTCDCVDSPVNAGWTQTARLGVLVVLSATRGDAVSVVIEAMKATRLSRATPAADVNTPLYCFCVLEDITL